MNAGDIISAWVDSCHAAYERTKDYETFEKQIADIGKLCRAMVEETEVTA